MAQGLLCDVCRQGREAKKYKIVIQDEHGNKTNWVEQVVDRCPRCVERLLKKISEGKL